MPRPAKQESSRVALRIRSSDKATIMRAVALQNTDLTTFMVRNAMRAAQEVIDQAEKLTLSERDTLRVIELLDDPPAPNAKLRSAARSLPSG